MTINGSTNSNLWTFKLEAYEINYSIDNNTSVVRVDVYLGRASSQSYLGGNWNGSITVDGSTQTINGNISYPTYINGGAWLYLTTRDFVVNHNDEGDKTANISATFSSSDFTPSSANANGNLPLTTIPRASSITATNADIGSATSININRVSNSFKHTLKYSFNGLTGTIASNIETSYGWMVPQTFYNAIPNSKSGTCTITCETYNNGSLIGTKTATFTVTVNEELSKPTITASVIDTNQTTIDLTGDSNKLIKYYSTAQISYDANPKNCATISKVTINNIEVMNSPYSILGNTYEQFIVTVIDSRGYSNSVTLNPWIVNYVPLTMNANVYRSDSTSGNVLIEFSGNYFNMDFGSVNNHLTLNCFYKLKTENEYTYLKSFGVGDYIIEGNTFKTQSSKYDNATSLGNIFDYQNSYDFIVSYSDRLISKNIYLSITKGIPIINWDDDMFNVNGKLKINNEEIFNLHIQTERECPTNIYIDDRQVYLKMVGIAIWNGTHETSTNLDVNNTNIVGYFANINGVDNNNYSYMLPNLSLASSTTLNNKSIPICLKNISGYWNIMITCNNLDEINGDYWGYVTIFYTKIHD